MSYRYKALTGRDLPVPAPAPAPTPTPPTPPAAGVTVTLTDAEAAIVSAWTAKPHWFKGATAAAKVLKAHGL